MSLSILQSQILLGEDSKRQFKRDMTNADALAAEMAAFSNSAYRGLGSGILRALAAWPQIDFEDQREANLFKVTIWRPH